MDIQNKARLTGLLYLLIFITAGFAQGAVREVILVGGDPGATAANIMQSEGLFRAGLIADLLAFLLDALVAVLLYQLLKPAGKALSAIAAAFRLIAHPAIGSLNLVNHYAALTVLTGSSYLNLPADTLSYLFMDLHNAGYLIAGAFFGIHLIILGILLLRSIQFPAFLGYLVMLAGAGYMIETIGLFAMPAYGDFFTLLITFTAVAGEGAFTLWLLFKGVRIVKDTQ